MLLSSFFYPLGLSSDYIEVIHVLLQWEVFSGRLEFTFLNVNPASYRRGLLPTGVGRHRLLARGSSWKNGVHFLPGVHL